MPEETLFEFESPQTRAEIAGRLRSLADGLNNGGPLTLTADDQSVTVTPPDSPEFELEVKRERSYVDWRNSMLAMDALW